MLLASPQNAKQLVRRINGQSRCRGTTGGSDVAAVVGSEAESLMEIGGTGTRRGDVGRGPSRRPEALAMYSASPTESTVGHTSRGDSGVGDYVPAGIMEPRWGCRFLGVA
jgi:hypothetical protein